MLLYVVGCSTSPNQTVVHEHIMRPISLPAVWPWHEPPMAAYGGGIHWFEISERNRLNIWSLTWTEHYKEGKNTCERKPYAFQVGNHSKAFWLPLFVSDGQTSSDQHLGSWAKVPVEWSLAKGNSISVIWDAAYKAEDNGSHPINVSLNMTSSGQWWESHLHCKTNTFKGNEQLMCISEITKEMGIWDSVDSDKYTLYLLWMSF